MTEDKWQGDRVAALFQAYEWVLHVAQRLEWSESAAKALVVIGDQVPHAASYTDQRTEWHAELDVLTAMGVKVYGVQAMNDGSATNFYRELAERTGGAYVKFTAFSVIADMFMAGERAAYTTCLKPVDRD